MNEKLYRSSPAAGKLLWSSRAPLHRHKLGSRRAPKKGLRVSNFTNFTVYSRLFWFKILSGSFIFKSWPRPVIFYNFVRFINSVSNFLPSHLSLLFCPWQSYDLKFTPCTTFARILNAYLRRLHQNSPNYSSHIQFTASNTIVFRDLLSYFWYTNSVINNRHKHCERTFS